MKRIFGNIQIFELIENKIYLLCVQRVTNSEIHVQKTSYGSDFVCDPQTYIHNVTNYKSIKQENLTFNSIKKM